MSSPSRSTRNSGVPESDPAPIVNEIPTPEAPSEAEAMATEAPALTPKPKPQPPNKPVMPKAQKPATPARSLTQSLVALSRNSAPTSNASQPKHSATPEAATSTTSAGLTSSVIPAVPPAEEIKVDRSRPIPAPSEPMQFRAIGLIRGKYIPSEEQITCGTLIADDGAEISAVLLGRVMSLVKKHIDLEQSHLWVTYPRTNQQDASLHLQVVGVWEPETLSQEEEAEPEAIAEKPIESAAIENDNYFSIRGEVVFYSEERECAIVKIRQAPRKPKTPARFFKISLTGKVEGRLLGHFWDFQVIREGGVLKIESGECIGPMPPKKRPKHRGKPKGKGGPKMRTPRGEYSRGDRGEHRSEPREHHSEHRGDKPEKVNTSPRDAQGVKPSGAKPVESRHV